MSTEFRRDRLIREAAEREAAAEAAAHVQPSKPKRIRKPKAKA